MVHGTGCLPSLCRNTRPRHLGSPTEAWLVMYTRPRFVSRNLPLLYIAASLSKEYVPMLEACMYLFRVCRYKENLSMGAPTNGIVSSEYFGNMVVETDDVYYTNSHDAWHYISVSGKDFWVINCSYSSCFQVQPVACCDRSFGFC